MVAGYLSLLYSVSEKPLEYWSKYHSKSGNIRKVLDSELLENVIEIQDFEQPNLSSTSILCPPDSSQFLDIELPFLVIVIKNLNVHCSFQVQVVDTQNCPHYFQFSSSDFERTASLKDPVICRVKLKLETGWNKLELDLPNLMRTAFKCEYRATQRLEIRGNCRLRRVYFIDRHYENHEICPKLYQGFLDSYMLKWGIRCVERSTQTNLKRLKSKIREDNSKVVSGRLSSSTLSTDDRRNNTTENRIDRTTRSRKTNSNFLRIIQTKTDELIKEFFDRHSTKLPRSCEFKENAKVKPYVVPEVTEQQKTVTNDLLEKLNVSQYLLPSTTPAEIKTREEENAKDTTEKWKDRYLLQQKKSLDNTDSLRNSYDTLSNFKKSILTGKPRSALLMSEMKARSEKGKAFETIRKYMETVKRSENNTIVT